MCVCVGGGGWHNYSPVIAESHWFGDRWWEISQLHRQQVSTHTHTHWHTDTLQGRIQGGGFGGWSPPPPDLILRACIGCTVYFRLVSSGFNSVLCSYLQLAIADLVATGSYGLFWEKCQDYWFWLFRTLHGRGHIPLPKSPTPSLWLAVSPLPSHPTLIHTYWHAHTHWHTQRHTYILTHTHILTHLLIHTHTDTHTYTDTHIHWSVISNITSSLLVCTASCIIV